MFAQAYERSRTRNAFRGAAVALAVTLAAGVGLSAQMPKHETPMNQAPMHARPDTVAARHEQRALVNVTSANWLDAHVYVVRDGLAMSLGVVTGPGEATLQVPKMATTGVADVQLMVLPIGSTEVYVSPVVAMQPGATVDLTIENSLELSHVEVTPPR